MIFTIKAGKHYARKFLGMRILFSNEIKFRFRISSTAMYDPSQVVNGWSKVFGISEILGHRNSCRLVYGCFTKDVLTVGMYCYKNGVSPQEDPTLKQTLGDILPDYWYTCCIQHYQTPYESYYYIMLYGNGVNRSFDMPARRYKLPFRFLLHPYIGGRYTLDQDCTIDIEKLK